jgi:hypothetical protein
VKVLIRIQSPFSVYSWDVSDIRDISRLRMVIMVISEEIKPLEDDISLRVTFNNVFFGWKTSNLLLVRIENFNVMESSLRKKNCKMIMILRRFITDQKENRFFRCNEFTMISRRSFSYSPYIYLFIVLGRCLFYRNIHRLSDFWFLIV